MNQQKKDKIRHLATLAADERTPDNERNNAGRALAKLVLEAYAEAEAMGERDTERPGDPGDSEWSAEQRAEYLCAIDALETLGEVFFGKGRGF